ncbi:Very-long-chain 3-oxoacyl-CoA synthase [Handroanthus impetiginosus]|uniref:3-ketoacyl-CoA synthase n=1 Tax=Handroanthus impetiginosus TaxID=429701 RepID=A0A2G9GGA2_9LAMI|nr:Very-long-chain 3-oxoacyl-CoA synthase [Handroanthus impetiginosus]
MAEITNSNTIINPIPFPYSQLLAAMVPLLLLLCLLYSKSRRVYLVDFSCYLPPAHLRVSTANFIEHFEICGDHEREAIDFQTKMTKKSGIGCEACLPLSMHQIPPDKSLRSTQEETEAIIFTVVKDLLSKQRVNPKNIDIVVTNCSIFCPTPSIGAMIINRFGFRSNVKSISLSGMGCSAGLVAISLAKDLLCVRGNSLALVLSMESVTPNGYSGRIKSMLLPNTLFRMGGVAILLSNKKQDKVKSKYKLRYLIRTHMGSDDQSYESVFQQTDDTGKVGVSLSRSLINVAANTLKTNLTELGPSVLPLSEQLMYAWSMMNGKTWNTTRKKEMYVPNFKKAFEHFCIHAGGRAVIDAVEERLKLSKEDAEASRMTLHRFGNTSSSSVWYELSYLEAKGRVRKGDRVWQIAFGSGFKCNSAVWECISDLDPKTRNAWSDSIHLYPVQIQDVADH